MVKKKALKKATKEEIASPPHPEDVLELDELWSFVQSKRFQVWIWVAINRRTRQIVGHYCGDRSDESCKAFWEGIPIEYRQCHSYSDFWASYEVMIDSGKHQSVGKESGETAHIERWFNTLRQRLGRFVRKTLSFSKCHWMHEYVLELFIRRYNNEIATGA